jgi:hypothetical protein
MSTANAEDQGGSESVELPEPDADEGGSASSGGSSEPEQASGGQPQNRKERRQSEFQAAQETARQAREEAATERRERERLAQEFAEFRGKYQATEEMRQRREAPDLYAAKIAELEDEAQMILEKVAGTRDVAEQKALMKKWNEKQREAVKLDWQRDQEKNERENPRQQQAPQMDARATAIWVAIEADYPAIADQGNAGKQFRSVADRYLDSLVAGGKPENLATFRAACAMAAKELKIGGHQASSNGQRGAYGGYPNGDGAGGRGGDGRPTLEVGPQQRALALALANRSGSGMSQEEATADWLKKVGPRVAKRMSEE